MKVFYKKQNFYILKISILLYVNTFFNSKMIYCINENVLTTATEYYEILLSTIHNNNDIYRTKT